MVNAVDGKSCAMGWNATALRYELVRFLWITMLSHRGNGVLVGRVGWGGTGGGWVLKE